jgi:hypothetical protein
VITYAGINGQTWFSASVAGLLRAGDLGGGSCSRRR